MSDTNNSAARPPSAEGASSIVRDFIYLDEAKIFSYLAQIEGGLRVLRQKVESELDTSSIESGGDTKSGQHSFEGQVSPAAAALAQFLTSFMTATTSSGLLAGAGGKYNYQRSWEIGTDKLKTESRELAASTDLSVIHHAAFDLVSEAMGSNFITIKGKLSILPLQMMADLFKVSETDGQTEAQKAIYMLKITGIENICYIENKSEEAHAFLNAKHFLLSPAEIFTAYGSPSEIDFTMVGLHAQRPKRIGKTSTPKQAGRAKELFKAMNMMFDQLWDQFGTNEARRLYPIAIYLEI